MPFRIWGPTTHCVRRGIFDPRKGEIWEVIKPTQKQTPIVVNAALASSFTNNDFTIAKFLKHLNVRIGHLKNQHFSLQRGPARMFHQPKHAIANCSRTVSSAYTDEKRFRRLPNYFGPGPCY